MNGAHIHLLLNHAPLIGGLFATVLLFFGHFRRQEQVRRAALWSFVILAPVALLVYLTGEPAEDVVEHLAGVEPSLIEPHEEFAVFALATMIATGVAAGLAILWERRRKKWLVPAVLVLALAATVCTGITANLGGKIRHPEVRADFKK